MHPCHVHPLSNDLCKTPTLQLSSLNGVEPYAALPCHMLVLIIVCWCNHGHCLLQAEFSLLDFKATDESTKMELPLYIEVKGERISSGCGSLTVILLFLANTQPVKAVMADSMPLLIMP